MNEIRLIDANQLKETIKSTETWMTVPVKKHMCKIIDNAPTVEKRSHGKWEEDWQEDLDFMSRKGWKCPFCKWRTTYGTPNFCMNCGADMREGGAE